MADVFERIREKLDGGRIAYTVSRHEPVFTSEQAAAVRGAPLSSGAKALIVKADAGFRLLVLPADRKLDSKKARPAIGAKSIRFATPEEVLELTGLRPGSIPPFGSLFGLATTVDPRLAENSRINFNAGDHSISIAMGHADYLKAEQPAVAEIA